MKNINWNSILLAFFVILAFISVGFALGQEIFWLAFLFLAAGFGLMGFGIAKKSSRKRKTLNFFSVFLLRFKLYVIFNNFLMNINVTRKDCGFIEHVQFTAIGCSYKSARFIYNNFSRRYVPRH